MKRRVIGVLLALGLVSLAAMVAVTGAAVAQDAAPLKPNQPLSNVLAGNAGGSFDMYQVAYPGGNEALTIQVNYSPADPVIGEAFGFNVYGSKGFSGQGEPTGDGRIGVDAFSYSGADTATMIVQVYNYGNRPVSYTIVASGITAYPVVTEAPTPTPEKSRSTANTGRTAISGSIFGNNGGAIKLYTFYYPGDGKDITLTMHLTPMDPSFVGWGNFEVYAPNGSRVATGQTTDDAGVRQATFQSHEAGTYTIQVYNYNMFVTMTYTITFSR